MCMRHFHYAENHLRFRDPPRPTRPFSPRIGATNASLHTHGIAVLSREGQISHSLPRPPPPSAPHLRKKQEGGSKAAAEIVQRQTVGKAGSKHSLSIYYSYPTSAVFEMEMERGGELLFPLFPECQNKGTYRTTVHNTRSIGEDTAKRICKKVATTYILLLYFLTHPWMAFFNLSTLFF